MSHNEAVLIYLLKNNNRWCSINEIRNYTKQVCNSECFQINTRASILRNKYGYDIENNTYYKGSIRGSEYRLALKIPILVYMRSLYPWKQIPEYNTVKNLYIQYQQITEPKTAPLPFQ